MVNSNGPALKPWIMKAPSNMAVGPSPGMPRASSGIMAPPMEALLEVSEATTPSMMPVPNFSGYFEAFFTVA